MSGGLPVVGSAQGAATEQEVLQRCRLENFTILEKIGEGSLATVFMVRCKAAGHPFPDKVYTLKVVLNYGDADEEQIRHMYQPEFALLRSLSSPAVVRCWSYFVGEMTPSILEQLSGAVRSVIMPGTFTMYGVLDFHPMTLGRFRAGFGVPVVPCGTLARIGRDLFQGGTYLSERGVLHRDLKLDNALVKSDGGLCFVSFDCAMQLPRGPDGVVQHLVTIGQDSLGGNQAHASPEVINTFKAFINQTTASVEVDYSGQAAFETAVLLYEFATGKHPLGAYPLSMTVMKESGSRVEYDATTCELPRSDLLAPAGYPDEFVVLIRDMLALNPAARPSLQDAAKRFDAMFPDAK